MTMHGRDVATSPPSLRARMLGALKHAENWVQLSKYVLVGGSGYLLNLAVFAFAVSVLSVHHLVAAVAAFVVAVSNNFWWNRRWTFTAHDGHAGSQVARFFIVNIAAFLVAAGLLELLVGAAGAPPIIAQAFSVGLVAPLTFVGVKIWAFGQSVPRA
jgi:dolichol-phosphate mannosyltransferase